MKPNNRAISRWRICLMRLLLLCLIADIIMPSSVFSATVSVTARPEILSPVLSKPMQKSYAAKPLTAGPAKSRPIASAKVMVKNPPVKSTEGLVSKKAAVAAAAMTGASASAPADLSKVEKATKSSPVLKSVAKPQIPAGIRSPVKASGTAIVAKASIASGAAAISSDCVACESTEVKPVIFNTPERIKTPPAQVLEYAKNFWDEADQEIEKRKINISGTKTFEMKQAEVSGDVGHFSTENYDSIPGFKLDQSLHLEIDGNITENSRVNAVLDDKEDEDRRFTVNIDGPVWKFVMGDFPLALEGTEFSLFQKEVRGILAEGSFHERFKSIFLFSQSKGLARREQFRGAGQQQEFRMQTSPIVQNSEKVSIDGRQLTRGTDYLIDYEEGLIKMLPHILPIEVTRWIVIEYETADENMAFTRNLFGTRQVYSHSEDRTLAMTWLREVDSTTPKSGVTATSTVTPMQHDLVSADADWAITPAVTVKAETAVSRVDPNRSSDASKADKAFVGNASRFGLVGKNDRADAELTWRRIDKDFKVVGREGGVLELGERGLVNDILSGRARLNYKFTGKLSGFVDGEQSETNLDDDPTLSAIDYSNYNSGFVWTLNPDHRLEVRGGQQFDRENGPASDSDLTRDTASLVYDRKIGKMNSQAKISRTGYDDAVNIASDSDVLEMNFKLGAEADETFSWNTGISRIAVEDDLVRNGLRSETHNYDLDLNYEPNRVFNARGLFQWRREDDFYANSRADTEIADSQLRYEPTRDLKTQLKYKIENTSKIIRDPDLDPAKYIVPTSLPNSAQKEAEILNRFENPVQKTTANFITDYRINRYLQAYLDWRRRDLQDQKTDIKVSSNDRRTYELRYTPFEKLMLTSEYEEGVNRTHEPQTELRDSIKSLQLRHEFYTGYILDTTYEEKLENDIYVDANDTFTKSSIMDLQHQFNNWASLELGLQYNDIYASEPSREWEKRLAVVLTPVSRSQRYRFFAKHKDISARISSDHYEGGLSFSQFIGTDTIIDGEVKRVHSSKGIVGEGYDATVFNAKMVITF